MPEFAKTYKPQEDPELQKNRLRTYDFYLRDDDSGRYDRSSRIVLPSVTAIIGSTLAKPHLLKWVYNQTIDSLSGLVSVVSTGGDSDEYDEDPLEIFEELLDTFSDSELLDEWIRDNRAHADDVLEEASQRGKRAHAFLSSLTTMWMSGPSDALKLAEKGLRIGDPYEKAVAQWWLDHNPEPIAAERVVFSLQHRYAGRLDFLGRFVEREMEGEPGVITTRLVDLKTRRADLGMYDSDQFQTDLYLVAARESHLVSGPVERWVLLAGDDSTYKFEKVWVAERSGLSIVDTFYAKRKGTIK